MKMRKIVPLSIILVMSLALTVASPQAKALVVPLHSENECGRVVVNNPKKNWPNFVLEMNLKDSSPNTEYYVAMYVINGPSLGYRPLGMLTTNVEGCGNFHYRGRLQPGHYVFYIQLFTEQPRSTTLPEQADHSTDIIEIELH